MTFGEYLRELRNEKNYKINRLAEMIDITSGYLSSIENGTRSAPSFEITMKIADALELSTDERYKLIDLAAESKNPPVLADDLNQYIINNPALRDLLRYTMQCKLSEKDWEIITAFIKKNYCF